MNRKLRGHGSQIPPVRPAADSNPESQKSGTAEMIHPQELGLVLGKKQPSANGQQATIRAAAPA